mmetsp:Transcript_1747/g.4137  ORF Transcript_1747/g.4137 Transcript_1747/m.4137 type:complete len:302 (-) Transcript_1747:1665-2570(-)
MASEVNEVEVRHGAEAVQAPRRCTNSGGRLSRYRRLVAQTFWHCFRVAVAASRAATSAASRAVIGGACGRGRRCGGRVGDTRRRRTAADARSTAGCCFGGSRVAFVGNFAAFASHLCFDNVSFDDGRRNGRHHRVCVQAQRVERLVAVTLAAHHAAKFLLVTQLVHRLRNGSRHHFAALARETKLLEHLVAVALGSRLLALLGLRSNCVHFGCDVQVGRLHRVKQLFSKCIDSHSLLVISTTAGLLQLMESFQHTSSEHQLLRLLVMSDEARQNAKRMRQRRWHRGADCGSSRLCSAFHHL